MLTDSTKTYSTTTVKIENATSGKAGLWLYQIGERQEFRSFELSRTEFSPPKEAAKSPGKDNDRLVRLVTDEYRTPDVPSPQDWVLVMERVSRGGREGSE